MDGGNLAQLRIKMGGQDGAGGRWAEAVLSTLTDGGDGSNQAINRLKRLESDSGLGGTERDQEEVLMSPSQLQPTSAGLSCRLSTNLFL